MSEDPGLLYGIVFFATLCAGFTAISIAQQRAARAKWLREHPPVPGSARRMLARLKRMARPSLWLLPSDGAGFSKLGGAPELPVGLDWPLGASGRREFMAQIDLAELQASAPVAWLPSAGRIYAFYDPQSLGMPDAVRVLYVDSTAPTAPRNDGNERPERRVALTPFTSIPSSDWIQSTDVLDMDFEAFAAEAEALTDGPSEAVVRHRISGYPDEIQNGCLRWECEYLARGLPELDYKSPVPEAIDRASKSWRLLLQLDSDEALRWSFGDGGMLYVFIREKDAQKGDFSKTVTLTQSY